MLASDYISQVRNLIHDQNASDFTDATLLGFVNQARKRVSLDTHCIRQFITGLNTITAQEQYPRSGGVGGVVVTAGGTSYSAAPTVTITGGGGTGAAASAVVTAGVITAINMTNWGAGYTGPVTVGITDGTGSGAAATGTVLLNVLDLLSVAILNGNDRRTLGWLPFTAFQAFCRAYTVTRQWPAIWTMPTPIPTLFLYAIPDQPYPMEWDAITTASDLAATNSSDTQIVDPWSDAVQYFAAYLAIASLQNYQQASYWYDGAKGVYDKRVLQLPRTVISRRIYNPYRTFARRLRRM